MEKKQLTRFGETVESQPKRKRLDCSANKRGNETFRDNWKDTVTWPRVGVEIPSDIELPYTWLEYLSFFF